MERSHYIRVKTWVKFLVFQQDLNWNRVGLTRGIGFFGSFQPEYMAKNG